MRAHRKIGHIAVRNPGDRRAALSENDRPVVHMVEAKHGAEPDLHEEISSEDGVGHAALDERALRSGFSAGQRRLAQRLARNADEGEVSHARRPRGSDQGELAKTVYSLDGIPALPR